MYLIIDNYDSFVHNLARYFEELGEEVQLVRNDHITPQAVEELAAAGTLEGVILSPGPKSPLDCGCCRDIVQSISGRIPLLGVCLGHQIIGHVFGASVGKGDRPMHGKVTPITHNGAGLFEGLPPSYDVTRYHSLVVRPESLPDCLLPDAFSADGALMALRHRQFPVYGVQFHPEAVLTQYGHELLANFTKICKNWRTEYEHHRTGAALLQRTV